MHAVHITFHSAVPGDQLLAPFTDFARALSDVPGFVSKAWLSSGDRLGGFYVFADAAAAEAYLASPMVADLQATEGFSDFQVSMFAVLDDLSALTGVTAPASA